MSSDDEINLSDKIDILSTEDEKLKSIGEILSSDSSRKVLKLLFNQSLTANEIAQKTEMSLPLVIHHLKKMQTVQVVKITRVGKNSKSHDMKYYTIDKFAIVILPSAMSTPAKKSKSLFNSFTRIHRLATLGGVSIAAWFSSQFLQSSNTLVENEIALQVPASEMMRSSAKISENIPVSTTPEIGIFWSVIVVLCIVIAGLSIEIIIKSKTKN